ncbi:uncharacterized protein GGS25DRAFT_184190 [Hypoxylon fragiforme]|uniref:uncharacterized protein n=1 Tax=Hypoxylon fragiforme TaxID=63214 RepID=UPI0020C65940|nr:uncharacterized protein GGS25DRAFT_184190 [Hypoxylon fragiforme]KAI2611158.1 hypothetical protein GGS25DRAFT_184190 [Hypoxylon fragiforme]
MRFSSFALAAFSLGSAFAAPAVQQTEPRALEILASVSTTIENTKAVVDVELKSLLNLALNVTVTTNLVPQLEQTILAIVGDVNQIVSVVGPLVNQGTLNLVEAELQGLPVLLQNVLGLTTNIQSTVQQVISHLGQDQLQAVQPELQLLLSSVEPAVKPLISFALGAVANITGDLNIQVNNVVGLLQNVLKGLLPTVLGVVGGIL